MYKTVRHGENSLQYTILPQTEEVINNSGLKGRGRDYSPSIHVRRNRRKSTIKYVFLVIFGIIIALALASIPLYVMNGALVMHRSQHVSNDVITSVPLTPTGREIVKSRKKELKITPDILLTLKSYTSSSTSPTTSTSTTTTVPTTVTSERATTPPWTLPAIRSWKSSPSSTTIPPLPTEDNDEIPIIGTPSGSVRYLDNYLNTMKPWNKDFIKRPSTTLEPIVPSTSFKNLFRHYSRFIPEVQTVKSIIYSDVSEAKVLSKIPFTTESATTERSKLNDLKDAILSVDDDDDFKEALEVDEVFSLPPLNPETPDDEVTISKAVNDNWYGAKWPFVDTSSYFQWSSYSPGDNLLLPLLVAALSSIALVLLLAIAVRRRKTSIIAAHHSGLSENAQEDDNTNLLAAENPEEPEE